MFGHISDQIYGNSYNFIYAYTHMHPSIPSRATSCSRFGVCFISRQGWILQTPHLHLIMYTVTYCDPVLTWVVPNSLYLQSPAFWPFNIISRKKLRENHGGRSAVLRFIKWRSSDSDLGFNFLYKAGTVETLVWFTNVHNI